MTLRQDCDQIIQGTLEWVRPDLAVCRALTGQKFGAGRLIMVAVGKAAWSMANSAWNTLDRKPDEGIVITKYGHSMGPIGELEIWETGHPVPDENTILATQRALRLTEERKDGDTVLFLLSGGGSALFEMPLVPLEELQDITQQLLASGADIVEINTIRKRLSGVKGGRFAAHCAPARIFAVILSDVVGSPLDMIASGPAHPDVSTCEQAMAIVDKYALRLSQKAQKCLKQETPKKVVNVDTRITGSVTELCRAAAENCKRLGYDTLLLTDSLTCQAKEAGAFLAAVARYYQNINRSLAFVAGGETVVKLTGDGKGGRNQEIALAAAEGIAGLKGTALFSFGSDGTDGPTDAAGGFVTGDTFDLLQEKGISVFDALQRNDAYHALEQCGGLLITGPTGTNVNDVSVLLIRRPPQKG